MYDDNGKNKPIRWRTLSRKLVWLVPVGCLCALLIQLSRWSAAHPHSSVLRILRGSSTPTMLILIANYRDTSRCAETLTSIFDRAADPSRLTIGIYDQIYDDEITCVDQYCQVVGEHLCRRDQMRSSRVNAENAKGPTVARYFTEELIRDEEFCLSIDSHMLFTEHWDSELHKQWRSIENEYAILTVYPISTNNMDSPFYKTHMQFMCKSAIEGKTADAMIQYGSATSIPVELKPRLQSQIAGGFNFGKCLPSRTIRNDPKTPFLFHGEEYSRAARLWTSGYDFYAPTKNVIGHWYEKRKVVWERDWGERYPIQQKSARRIRHMLGLNTSNDTDIDLEDLEHYSLGSKRTFAQWEKFTGIDPRAPYVEREGKNQKVNQFNNCKEKLELVPWK